MRRLAALLRAATERLRSGYLDEARENLLRAVESYDGISFLIPALSWLPAARLATEAGPEVAETLQTMSSTMKALSVLAVVGGGLYLADKAGWLKE
jgi:hypothetical protein